MTAPRLGVLNGLRGVAFLLVLHHHLWSPLFPVGWWLVGGVSLGAPLTHGYVGVHLFFVLSGAVLALPYLEGRRAMATRADLLDFYRRRAARLLPLYYLVLFVTLAFVHPPPASAAGVGDVLRLATFTFPFSTSMWSPPHNWVLWSLGIEVWLSVLFPLLLVLIARVGVRRTTLGAVAIALAVRALGHGHAAFDVGNPYLDAMSDSVLGRIDDFALGVAAIAAWRARPAGAAWRPLLLGAALVWAGMIGRDHLRLEPALGGLWPATHLVLGGGCALGLLGALRASNAIRAALSAAWLQVVGLACYSLYLWHDLVIRHVVRDALDVPRLALGLVLLGGLAAMTYRYVELRAAPSWRAAFATSR